MNLQVALNKLRKRIPQPVKATLRRYHDAVMDGWDALTDRSGDPVPPRRLSFVGSGDFRRTGNEFLGLFRDIGGLKPGDRVLDVGCGIGRMAIPLTRYLDAKGSYEGFDIVPAGIEWCRARITPRYPNFRFQLADLRNETYNPGAGQPADRYRFPFADGEFDFVFLTSVYTHLMPDELRHYLRECARVLKPGGRMFGTFLLLTDESFALMKQGDSRMDFNHDLGECHVVDPAHPAAAVGYREPFVRERIAETGLEIVEPIRWGSWCGRQSFTSFQDIVVARKPGAR